MSRPSPAVARERRRCARIAEESEDAYMMLAEKAKAAGDANHQLACLARAWAAQEIGALIRLGQPRRPSRT